MPHELRHDSYIFSDNPALLDLTTIHAFLTNSYWSPGIARETVERATRNSIPFGVYDTSASTPAQVGFARIITDRATFAYLADVFILEAHRRRGLSKLLIQHILSHPDLQGLRRVALMTRDAQGLYQQFGFTFLDDPRRFMERRALRPV